MTKSPRIKARDRQAYDVDLSVLGNKVAKKPHKILSLLRNNDEQRKKKKKRMNKSPLIVQNSHKYRSRSNESGEHSTQKHMIHMVQSHDSRNVVADTVMGNETTQTVSREKATRSPDVVTPAFLGPNDSKADLSCQAKFSPINTSQVHSMVSQNKSHYNKMYLSDRQSSEIHESHPK